jgi:hypothetical protein
MNKTFLKYAPSLEDAEDGDIVFVVFFLTLPHPTVLVYNPNPHTHRR